MKKLENIRTNYSISSLSRDQLLQNPIEQFKTWFSEVVDIIIEPTSMTLSTYTIQHGSQSRVVLLKQIDQRGFVFFTNYNSLKGKQIALNNNVSLSFFWPELQRQVRVNGIAKKVSNKVSLNYFSKRPRNSQISAWMSMQSEVIENRKTIESKFQKLKQKFNNQPIPRPPYWGGYIVEPLTVEFWQGREDRMHDRFIYIKHNNKWNISRLSP
ncbi:MAG: pyridoxamine 5'-phosphate oxidase [Flavobacteriales bacterium]|nr:pyridoxamine 5'-phosphate oxidase [Flavobacteriales bacterium]|tara:strand:- start:470 stop:1105 length:636 start_codon:yes stop_codon:yes gene_type:complete